MITRIYEEAKLNRDLRATSSLSEISVLTMPSDTTFNATAHPRSRTVFLRISDYCGRPHEIAILRSGRPQGSPLPNH